MNFVTRREIDLSEKELEALTFLSRTLGMQDNYATVTFDEDALRDAMTPAPVVAPVETETPPAPVTAAPVLEEGTGEEEQEPVVATSSLPALVTEEMEQDTAHDERASIGGEEEQHSDSSPS